MRDRVARLVDEDLARARYLEVRPEAEAHVLDRAVKCAPLASSSATVAAMSSHISEIEWWRGCECSWPSQVYEVGCTPSSLGPVLKMSQPGTSGSSTHGQPRTSRRNSRVATGSSE